MKQFREPYYSRSELNAYACFTFACLEWPIKITMQLQLVIALVAERSKAEQGLVIVM